MRIISRHLHGPAKVALACSWAVLVVVLLSSCGHRPEIVTEQNIPGYQQLIEDMRHIDPAPLAGRLILLDPGHGGKFRGAIGPNGLAEADVNLGVALYLRGLLEWAGATVAMTRTTDRDFLTATDSTLVSDLAFRVSMMDSLQPDVFISLHHNSNPRHDPVINATQTYYPLGDEGPSLELARAIHRHLALNLQITPAQIMPGNFHVLRNATVPAVLGEPAMISNPVMAGRLSLAASQRLEAEAYFLGLLDYFSQGAPRWETDTGDTLRLSPSKPLPVLTWTFVPDHRRRGPSLSEAGLPGPDPASFHLVFNGRDQGFLLSPDGRTLSWSPPSRKAAGWVEIQGRNLAGRSTPVRRTLILDESPSTPLVTILAEARGDKASTAAFVTWQSSRPGAALNGVLAWSQGPTIPLGNQDGGAFLVDAATPIPEGAIPQWITASQPEGIPCPLTVLKLPAPWRWHQIIGLPTVAGNPGGAFRWRYRLGSLPPGMDPDLVPAGFLAAPAGRPLWIEGAGLVPFMDPGNSDRDAGTSFKATEARWPATLVEPAVWGKTIVLDPRGGSTDTDGEGPLGTRGSDLNLEVARLTAQYLRGAGAKVVLTRTDDQAPADPAKVLLARKEQADLFLVIGRRGAQPGPRLRHYPGSPAGTAWARAMSGILDRAAATDSAEWEPGPGDDYLLRHTHCPALVVELHDMPSAAWEISQSRPRCLQRTAAALAVGIMGHLSGQGADYPSVDMFDILGILRDSPPSEQITGILWDGYLSLIVDDLGIGPSGSSSDTSLISPRPLLPAGGSHHQLEIQTGDSWRVWILEQKRGRWQGKMVLSGP